MAEAIDVKELAQLGRDYTVPQLLNQRANKHYRANPTAQAIAYADALAQWRRLLVCMGVLAMWGLATAVFTFVTVEHLPDESFTGRYAFWLRIIGLSSFMLGAGGGLASWLRPNLPPKGAAEGFAEELTLIRDWYGSWHSVWSWPTNHFGLKKMGEVILAGLRAKVLRDRRELEKVTDDAARAKRKTLISRQEAIFDQAHALLLKYEMAEPPVEYYHEKGQEELAKQDKQAGLIAEYHELNHVSFDEPDSAAETAQPVLVGA